MLVIIYFKVSAQSGSIDYSFGDSGKVISESYQGVGYASLIQPDGKIIIGGAGNYSKDNLSIAGSLLARYDSDGNLDFDFKDSGRAIYNLRDTFLSKTIYAIALQSDGKIIAAVSG